MFTLLFHVARFFIDRKMFCFFLMFRYRSLLKKAKNLRAALVSFQRKRIAFFSYSPLPVRWVKLRFFLVISLESIDYCFFGIAGRFDLLLLFPFHCHFRRQQQQRTDFFNYVFFLFLLSFYSFSSVDRNTCELRLTKCR